MKSKVLLLILIYSTLSQLLYGQAITLDPIQNSSFQVKINNGSTYGDFTTTQSGGGLLHFRLAEPPNAIEPSGINIGYIRAHPVFFAAFSTSNTNMNVGADLGSKIHFDVSTGRTGFFADPQVNPIDFLPKSTFHFKKAESGVNPNANTLLFMENAQNSYLGFGVPNNNESGILFGRPDQGSTSGGIIYKANKAMEFRTFSNSPRMLIDSTGRVGIGTISPKALTHIFNGFSGSNPNSSPDVIIEDNDHTYLNLLTPVNRESGILFGIPGNGTSGGIIYNNSLGRKSLQFRTHSNATQMTIDSVGNVAIGRAKTTLFNALSILHMNNNGTTPTKLTLSHNFPTNSQNLEISLDSLNRAVFMNQRFPGSMAFGLANSSYLNINSIGHVGLGQNNTVPTARLHLHESNDESKNSIRLTNSFTGNSAFDGLEITLNTDDSAELQLKEQGGNLSLGVNNKDLLILDEGGVRLGAAQSFLNRTNVNQVNQINDLSTNGQSVIKFEGTGAITLTGINDGADNGILHIYTTKSVTILTIKNDDTSSNASARILTGASGGGDLIISGDGGATLIYDQASNRWRVIGYNP